MAKAYRKEDFDRLMARVVKVYHRVKDYLEEAGYIECLEQKICMCGSFQHNEIPCEHEIAVLKHKTVTDMHPYCSDYYKSDALEKTCEVAMIPMPDKED
ncbi:hypothetical protein H5410_010316 [Solanum commersonii]|uniref:SWIM-type domain-containing protein n=1 Tax=Solanum commersonii TaxID=4109 RepID=A0A9J6ALX5_SOLCO|nr:hypothetical protein H5410_010316 [Solanum commersonii]